MNRQLASEGRRGGTTRLVEAAILTAIVMALIAAALMSGSDARRPLDTMTVKVRGGATLWELASAYRADGMSTAQTVEVIAELNGLKDGRVSAGQTLEVPRNRYSSAVASR